MTKQEWIEYFKTINNRMPNIQEVEMAILKGDITDTNINSNSPKDTLSNQFENNAYQNDISTNTPNMYYQQNPNHNLKEIKKKKKTLVLFLMIITGLFIIIAIFNSVNDKTQTDYVEETIKQETETEYTEDEAIQDTQEIFQYSENAISTDLKILDNFEPYENDIYKDGVYISSNVDFEEYSQWIEYFSIIMNSLEEFWRPKFDKYSEPILIVFKDSINVSFDEEKKEITQTCYYGNYVFYNLSDINEDYATVSTEVFGLAHELGHHIQNSNGDLYTVKQKKRKMIDKRDMVGANRLNIRTELQADYYAGVFCKYMNSLSFDEEFFSPEEIEEIINSTINIGDDVILGENYSAETSDHGTSEQRKRWFWHGYNDDNLSRRDIFSLEDYQL